MLGLAVNNLCYGYGDHTVFEQLTFRLEPGQRMALFGPSGIGKSTLLKLIAQIYAPKQGQIQNQFKRMAFVFQEPRLLPWLTVRQNIDEVMKAHQFSCSARQSRIQTLLSTMQLQNCIDHYPHQLSGGMAQRVSLARALSIEPQLLLLDEPMSGLDQSIKDQLSAYLQCHLSPDVAMIYTSHQPADAWSLCNRAMVIKGANQCFQFTDYQQYQQFIQEKSLRSVS